MARDAIDAAAHSLRTTVNVTVRDSITERVPLVGADGFEIRSNQRVLLARRAGLHVARVDHLLGRYGGMVDDVLTRRTRISIETFDRGVAAAPGVARLMADELGWDQERLDDEVDHSLRRVEAERLSQAQLTDQEADEARVKAPDIV
jgi:glycerol-3-phosphate dehydrogenase